MTKYSILLIVFLKAFIGFGQGGTQNSEQNDFMKNLTPPTPNTASLGLYGEVPLNQFTGNPQISIPIYNIKSKNIEVPISLSYSSDGIKVDQYESNVGMGWALNCGGAIVRQVFDYPDNYNGRLQKPAAALNSSVMIDFLQQTTEAPQVDTQPDIYLYNIGGITGKFFLNDNNMPVEIEPSGNKIEITSSFLDMGGEIGSSEPEIIITDTKGIKYFFGGLNAIESSYTRRLNIEAINPPSDDIKTAWYLTMILDSNSNDSVVFNYSSRHHTYISGNDQKLDYEYGGSVNYGSTFKNYLTESHSYEAILDQIIYSSGKINFLYSHRTTDTNFTLLKLDSIECFDNNEVTIKKTDFLYSEYISNTFLNQYNSSPNYLRKRFYLMQVNEYSNNSQPIKHSFEYYSPQNLPARFSFSQDIYGLFNGKINTNLFSNKINMPNSVINAAIPNGVLADRDPDSNFGYFGLLKKIIYPTGGYAELQYEPHVDGTRTVEIYPTLSSCPPLSGSTNNEDYPAPNSLSTANILSSVQQTVTFTGSVGLNTEVCTEAELSSYPSAQIKSTFEVIDLSTNNAIPIFKMGVNSDSPIYHGTSWEFTSNPTVLNKFFYLEANKNYLVRLRINRTCLTSTATFRFYSQPITTTEVVNEVGGFRVSKIVKSDGVSSEIERYFYSKMDCLTCQSGRYINVAPAAYIRVADKISPCHVPNTVRQVYYVNSSTMSQIYSSQNVRFGYEYVTKSFGNNFENGGLEWRYLIEQDGLPVTSLGIQDPTTPFTNGFNSGKLRSQKTFKRNIDGTNTLIKELRNTYFHDISKDLSINGYSAFKSQIQFAYIVIPTEAGAIAQCYEQIAWDNYSLNEYKLRSQWHYLKSSETIGHFSNGGVSNTTVYNYNNSTHLQLSTESTTNSMGEILENKYFYPQDPEMVSEPHKDDLIALNIISTPLLTQTFKHEEKISEQKTIYEKDVSTNDFVLPKYIYTKKGADSPTNPFERKITFDEYDSKGNLLQYTTENGTPTCIIWGYNQTQPIAKIENATNIQIASALGVSVATADESNLSAINDLRTSMPNAMVTTYTYIPLVGLSTITDPKGYTTTYEYDNFGRLSKVKDAQGKILTENEYNYRTQN